jgi:hypothetical protein
VPKPIASWNPARDVWETPDSEGLFCEHWDVFSETFPSSGTTRGGTAYALPTWEQRTAGSASSSSPTLLGTPTSRDWKNVGTPEAFSRRSEGHAQPLTEVVLHGLT